MIAVRAWLKQGRKRWLTLLVLLSALGLCFCFYKKNRPEPAPSFHPLPDFAYEYKGLAPNGEPYQLRRERIVIANPPTDRKTLQVLVDAYNQQTLSKEVLSKWSVYDRWFYKESRRFPRNYKEKDLGFFDADRIEDHNEDLVLIVSWQDFGKERTYEFEDDAP